MKTIFDLPEDLVEAEIFSRVSLTSLRSVRSTCKKWNTLCKNRILFGQAAKKQFLMMDSRRVCLINFDLSKDSGPSVELSVLNQIQISNVFYCDGLLLCLLMDSSRLLVWNPYLGQTRWIEPRNSFEREDNFSLGYDSNLNHKILRIFDEIHPVTDRTVLGFELYDFSSSSWKVLDVTQARRIPYHRHSASLKGNAYFTARKNITEGRDIRTVAGFFVCFDFSKESFGRLLPLPPFHSYHKLLFAALSCVREEQLAVLHQHLDARETIEISVTDKIGPDVVSWTKFLKVNFGYWVQPFSGSFLVDEEKKIAVFFALERAEACDYQTAHLIGQDGYFKSVRIRETPDEAPDLENNASCPYKINCAPDVRSSYLPSLVQLNRPG